MMLDARAAKRLTGRLFVALGIALIAACQPAEPLSNAEEAASATPAHVEQVATFTPISTVAVVSATPTASASPTPTAMETATATPIPPTASSTANHTPSASATASHTPAPSSTPTLARVDHYWLARPIAQVDGNTHWLDRTYPYGGTQFGTREVHLGVEFVNTRFTPVLAAARGSVLFAGEDAAIQFGPQRNYYGNLVVVQHEMRTADGLPLYTLYAHLQDIAVETGQPVIQGQRLGRVGDTGIAIGPHLHFEVRAGDVYDYRSTRNPDLWIEPYPRFGTLAGRLSGTDNPYGIVIHVRGPDFQRETYTYGSERVNPDPAWNENYTLGDMPAGDYEVYVTTGSGRTLFRSDVSITAGQTTWLPIVLDE